MAPSLLSKEFFPATVAGKNSPAPAKLIRYRSEARQRRGAACCAVAPAGCPELQLQFSKFHGGAASFFWSTKTSDVDFFLPLNEASNLFFPCPPNWNGARRNDSLLSKTPRRHFPPELFSFLHLPHLTVGLRPHVPHPNDIGFVDFCVRKKDIAILLVDLLLLYTDIEPGFYLFWRSQHARR